MLSVNVPVNLMCLSVHRCTCVQKKNQLDATELFIALNFTFVFINYRNICVQNKNPLDAIGWFIALIICPTFFGHFYAHHQELETICVLLPPMVCSALVAGCRRSGRWEQAMRPR